ncbi:MAG TPA: hypothetical protein VEK07_19615 [Polyangiaceae bacterium]|nr:hypothetical protein [Polyangiaceae bacterium]
MRTVIFAAWLAAGALTGCAAAQNAAKRDPMTCERDPSCAKSRGAYSDCSQQCVDDPDCTDRCHEAQMDRGLGH